MGENCSDLYSSALAQSGLCERARISPACHLIHSSLDHIPHRQGQKAGGRRAWKVLEGVCIIVVGVGGRSDVVGAVLWTRKAGAMEVVTKWVRVSECSGKVGHGRLAVGQASQKQ